MRQGTYNQPLAVGLRLVPLPQKSRQKLPEKTVKPERPMISMLHNCGRFSLDMVFIAREQARYRLIVLQKGKFIKKDYYTNLKGARLAFHKSFVKGESKRLKWSEFFKPKKNFLDTLYYSIETKKFIAMLMSAQYLIETAFIMAIDEGYRLIVNHKKVSLADEVFKSFDQASAAFFVRFKDRSKNEVKPLWSEFYPPSIRWLNKHLAIARGF